LPPHRLATPHHYPCYLTTTPASINSAMLFSLPCYYLATLLPVVNMWIHGIVGWVRAPCMDFSHWGWLACFREYYWVWAKSK